MGKRSIVDVFTPTADRLLVRRDPDSRQVGVGMGGKALIAPETAMAVQPCRSGVVLKAGPDATYPPGTRVAFGRYAMVTLQMEGEAGDEEYAVGLLPSTEVLCTFTASEEELPRPLGVEGADYASAPDGYLLVERSEIPSGRGRIIMPETYTEVIRSLEATVRSVGCGFGTDRFMVGDLILLNSSVGRHIAFGIRAERVLWAAIPAQVMGYLDATLEEDLVPEDDSTLALRGPLRVDRSPVRWDEGDPSAPR